MARVSRKLSKIDVAQEGLLPRYGANSYFRALWPQLDLAWGGSNMKMLYRRDQRSGLLGKVVFSLDVRAELSSDERDRIKRYKLGETELYASHELHGGSGLLGVASKLAWKAIVLKITVNDLVSGKRVEAKDIVEMLAIEDQIKEAAGTFKAVLDAASQFGGEEVIEI